MMVFRLFSKCSSYVLFFISSFAAFAQTGPGGVGNASGEDQPRNLIWLDASTLGLADGATVSSWPDQSGNGNDFGQLGSENLPVFEETGLASSSHNVVRFDGTERYLSLADNTSLDALPGVSIFLVFQSSALGGPRGLLSKRISSGSNEEYSVFTHTSNFMNFDIRASGSDSRSTTDPVAIGTSTNYVFSAIYGSSTKSMFAQSVQAGTSQSKTGTISNGTAPVILGALNENYGTYFSGDIAEVIVYGQGLNAAQRLVIENYLSQKYNIAITNDYYTGTDAHDLVGIGSSGGESHDEAYTAGLTLRIYDGSFASGEFVMAAHDNTTASFVTDSLNGNATMQERWSKSWYIEKTGNVNVSLAFDFGDVIGGQYPQETSDYRLVRRNGANFEEVTTASVSTLDDNLVFTVEDANFSDGYYSIATVDNTTAPLDGGAQRIWYSYKSGNWEDPLVWTLDGSTVPQYVNPSATIPTGSDKVVINSGKTVQMLVTDGSSDFNSATVSSVQVIGTLDLGTSYGHIFGTFFGTGKVILEGSSLDGGLNFLAGGDVSQFVSSTGGTVEIQGNGLDVDADIEVNDLIINLSSNEVVLLSDLTVNGDLTIINGTLQINDNVSTTSLNIDLHGDLLVGASGAITTGTGNARHEFNFYGDFSNEGSVAFTQRTTQTTGSEATDGIVDANFVSDEADQSISCSNTTHFYRIEISKGADDTYVLNIDADDPSYFNLNGYAAQSHGSVAQLTTNTNALGLLYGTVRLGTNVEVNPLNTGGNYNISEAARLWVDGGVAVKSAGTAIVPYGGVLVSEGELTASINSGITTRGNGYLTVTGGKVLMNQFRTSVYGAVNQGGYSQSGGEVYVSGGSTSTDYYTFSSTYEGNTFSMTGGVLTVNANSRGGIFINGSDGNFNVSGGEVVCELDNNNDFLITSKAPFYKLTVRKTTSNSGYVTLGGGTSANGSSDPRTLAAQPLVVLDDLTLQGSAASYTDFDGITGTTGFNASFNANGVDMYLKGSLVEQVGATFTSGANTIYFDGSGMSLLNFDPASSQTVNNITVSKEYRSSGARVTGGNTTSALTITGNLTVDYGKLFIQTFNVAAQGAVVLNDTIGSLTSTGKLLVNGGSAQTLTTNDMGLVFDMELNNASGLSLSGDLSVDSLTLTNGVFDINTDKLTLFKPVLGSGFSTSKMIQTAGNASDGGLEILVAGGVADPDAVVYPMGTDANATTRYTPVTLDLENVTDEGYVSFSIADRVLSTTDPAGGDVLSYYWKLSHRGFSAKPDIEGLSFIADESDDVDGSDGNAADDATSLPDNWVTGKVEDNEDSDDAPGGDISFNAMETPGSISVYTIAYTGNDAGNGVGPYTLSKANFTIGEAARFATSPTVFYTRKTSNGDQNWNSASSWSTVATQGAAAARYPGQSGNVNDIAVIGAHDSDNHGFSQEPVRMDVGLNTQIAALIFEEAEAGESRGRLFPLSGTNHSWGEVSGDGEIQLFFTNSGNVPTFDEAETDFGGFFNELNSTWNLAHDGGSGKGNRVTMPTFPSEFPNLRVTATGGANGGSNGWGSQKIIEFTNDIKVNNSLQVVNRAALYVQSNIEIDSNLYIGVGYGHGRLRFPNGATSYEVSVGKNIIVGQTTGGSINDNYIDVEPGNTNNVDHLLMVGGDITLEENGNGTDGYLDLFLSGTENQVILNLVGTGNNALTNNTDQVPDLYRIKMDKGSDTTSSFSFDENFVLNGSSTFSTVDSLAIVIQNGLLKLNHASINVTLADGGADFEIPSTGGLDVMAGTASVLGDDTGILLDGFLRVSGGTLDLDDAGSNGNNFIEYSSSGSAILEVSVGSLTVGSQIRRSLTATAGILKYHQSGGDVVVGKNAAPQTSRGVFEVVNTGSEFEFTGGTFTVVRGVNSTTVPSLLLEPETYGLTGSTIVIGNADTPSGTASSRIGIKSSVPVYNLTLNNSSGNNPTSLLYSRPLTVNGTLTINTGATLNPNGFNLTLNGDFLNNGSYTPMTNTTTFSASGAQSYSGSGTSAFYNMVKTGAGTLSLSNDITVNNDISVLQGTLSHGSNAINILGDATVRSTISTSSGSGLVFMGTAAQQLIGKTNTDISIGIITINNIEGVGVPDGNGYTFTITEALRLSEGLFDVGGSLLTIDEDATIEAVNTFGATNMVQTNSSYTDNGIRKIFSGSEPSFTFPVGESKYTPLVLSSIASMDNGGSITVRPANELHPSVTDDPATADIDETQNALQYHWVVKSSGIGSSVVGTARFYYDQTDVLAVDSAETDYVAARLTLEEYQWDKAYGGTAVDAVNNTITFPLDQSVNLAGEYTAGIDNAFRDVPEYRSAGDVNFSSATNWEVSTDGGSNWSVATVAPAGARVTISTGDELTIDNNNVRLLTTFIDTGSRVFVDPSYFGTRLGEVSGTGTLVLHSEVFPSGNYESFLTCSGGAIEYGSANSYTILSGIANVREVVLDGSGTRTMSANAIEICEDLVINGPTLVLENSNEFVIKGDFELNSGGLTLNNSSTNIEVDGNVTLAGGTFTGFTGADFTIGGNLTRTAATFTPNNTDFFFDGAATQNVVGSFALNNVTVNNTGAGLDLTGGGIVTVKGVLTMTDGLITTATGNTMTITSTGSYTGASAASYFNGPMGKNSIGASATYTFPVGKGGRYSPVRISNVTTGGQNWSAEYFTALVDATVPTTAAYDNSDPGSGYNSLARVKSTDRWNVTSSGSNTAFVRLKYDAHNSFPETDEIRVIWWDAVDARWENQGGIAVGTAATGTVTSENAIHFSSQEFGLGSAPEGSLPVTYTYFTAQAEEKSVVLKWQTATEISNDYFVIQRSQDGTNFEDIGVVSGHGDSKELISYKYTDLKPYVGASYYRLKQVDYDGAYEYSKFVLVNFELDAALDVDVYPNPSTQDNINVRFTTEDITQPLVIRVMGLDGHEYLTQEVKIDYYTGTLKLSVQDHMSSGVYLLFLSQGNKMLTNRLIVR